MDIKLYGGVTLAHDGAFERFDYICELWDMFGWDIENDPKAKECATEITRQLLMFGEVNLKDNAGKTILINLLPVDE